MGLNKMKRDRHSVRLRYYDYSAQGRYFVTICTNNRECLFGRVADNATILNQNGAIIQKIWNDLPNRYDGIILDAFVVMPNHVHGIIEIIGCADPIVGAIHALPLQVKRRQMLFPKIIGYFKMNSAKHINELRHCSDVSVWQRNYYEHVIRNNASLDRIRNYIINNPSNWTNDWNYRT